MPVIAESIDQSSVSTGICDGQNEAQAVVIQTLNWVSHASHHSAKNKTPLSLQEEGHFHYTYCTPTKREVYIGLLSK